MVMKGDPGGLGGCPAECVSVCSSVRPQRHECTYQQSQFLTEALSSVKAFSCRPLNALTLHVHIVMDLLPEESL